MLDTGVVLQAALNPNGPARRILDRVDAGEVVIFVSPALRSEYEAVLRRDALRERFPQLTEARLEAIFTRLDEKAVFVAPVPAFLRFERDPNDEMVLNLAVHADVTFIVARDRDLLDLGMLRSRIRICDPVSFLQELERTGTLETSETS